MEPLPAGSPHAAGFYAAYRTFVDLLDGDDHAIEITLRPGNSSPSTTDGSCTDAEPFGPARRHLQGCYIDIDTIRSKALGGVETTTGPPEATPSISDGRSDGQPRASLSASENSISKSPVSAMNSSLLWSAR